MRTTKGIPWRMGLWGLVAGATLALMVPGAQAQTTGACTDVTNCTIGTDRSASLVIYPKIVVDTDAGVDTVVQLTNVSTDALVNARCFYVNANGHCSNNGQVCNPSRSPNGCDTGASCDPGWVESDFRLTLTKRQPISWKASDGLQFLPCPEETPSDHCIQDT